MNPSLKHKILLKDLPSVPKEKIKILIKKSFNKYLKDEFFKKDKLIFTEKNFKGIAIIIPNIIKDIQYLDLLAVNPKCTNNGLGTDLLNSAINITNKLFWRSSLNRNPLTIKWYKKKSDFYTKYKDIYNNQYFAFTIGLNPEEIKKALEYLRKKPSNFK